MRMLLIGDIHGRIFHLLKIVQKITSQTKIDFIIQVGDFGYFTNPDQLDESTIRFSRDDPSELHTVEYFNMDQKLISLCKESGLDDLVIHFIRGNHENHQLLKGYNQISELESDPLACLRYVPDGTILDKNDITIGFLGGVESPNEDGIDPDKVSSLKGVDILITHDGPYGIAQGFKGQLQGSKLITQIITEIQPKYHFYGHYHIVNGPTKTGRTLTYGLSTMVLPIRRNPELDINPGSLGIFDTETKVYSLVDTTGFRDLRRDMRIEDIIKYQDVNYETKDNLSFFSCPVCSDEIL